MILNSVKGIYISFQIAKKGDRRVLQEAIKDRILLLKHLVEKRNKFCTFADKTERLFKVDLKCFSYNETDQAIVTKIIGRNIIQFIVTKVN